MSLFKMVLVLSLSLMLVVTECCTTIQLPWFLLTPSECWLTKEKQVIVVTRCLRVV